MNILVTNDDGVHAPGLWALAEALQACGDVTVVAPDRDQSGIGAAMTLLDVVRAREIEPQSPGIRTFSVEGTPADCVILATETLVDGGFDFVVSGINRGANLGLDIMNSGTLGSAFQGFFRGIRSIAMSVTSLSAADFDPAARTAASLVGAIAENGIEAPLLLNVNLPNVPTAQMEQARLTLLGPRVYAESVEYVSDARRSHYWIRHNKPLDADVSEGTDAWATRNKCVSITPVDAIFANGVGPRDLGCLAEAVNSALGLN